MPSPRPAQQMPEKPRTPAEQRRLRAAAGFEDSAITGASAMAQEQFKSLAVDAFSRSSSGSSFFAAQQRQALRLRAAFKVWNRYLQQRSERRVNLQWAADWHKVKQQGSAVHAAMDWAAFRVWRKEQVQDEALDAHDAAQAEREAMTAFKVWQGAEQATEEAVQQPAQKAVQQPAQNAVQPAQEAVQQPAQGAAQDAAQQPAQETTQDAAQGAVQDAAQDAADEADQDAAQDAADEAAQDAAHWQDAAEGRHRVRRGRGGKGSIGRFNQYSNRGKGGTGAWQRQHRWQRQ